MSIDKLHKKLIKTKNTISIAESCTGGLLSSKLTKLSGSSKYFKMGLITYSNNAKIKILKVKKSTIDKYGAVSQECCKSMVENLSKLSKCKINLSITGVAGPKGGTKNKPVQTLVERYTQLSGVKYVDEIIPYQTEQDLCDILSMYHINVRVLGEEYRERDFTGKDVCRKRGIELHFNKREHRFSTTDLRERVNNAPSKSKPTGQVEERTQST